MDANKKIIQNDRVLIEEKSLEFNPIEVLSDEKNFLSGLDSLIVQLILYWKDLYKTSCNEEVLANKDIINLYNKFIELASNIIKDIGISSNSISYSYVVERLLHLGYFSHNLSIDKGKEESDYIWTLDPIGIQVILGVICCRHAAGLHQDIFESLGLRGEKVTCLQRINISREQAMILPCNHSINILEFDGVLYGHDVFNKKYYRIHDSYLMQGYYGDSIYYKPQFDMVINRKEYEEVIKNLHSFCQNANKKSLTDAELEDIIDESEYRYSKNCGLLGDFYHETKEITSEIVRMLSK